MTTALTILAAVIALPVLCAVVCAVVCWIRSAERFCQGDVNDGSPLL